MPELKLVSYNLHKGKNFFGRSFGFDTLNSFLKMEQFDIGFFQEVLGDHQFDKTLPHQMELIADKKWHGHAFTRNSIVSNFDHGNSILSKHPIIEQKILNLTLHSLEKRSAIFVMLDLGSTSLACICTHLNLRQKDRIKQARLIIDFINNHIDKDTPLILAGDFNDWNGGISHLLETEGHLSSHSLTHQTKTFPSFMPFLALDRIYYRNIKSIDLYAGETKKFRSYSDHLPLFNTISFELNK